VVCACLVFHVKPSTLCTSCYSLKASTDAMLAPLLTTAALAPAVAAVGVPMTTKESMAVTNCL
jgi:hypothetical protein